MESAFVLHETEAARPAHQAGAVAPRFFTVSALSGFGTFLKRGGEAAPECGGDKSVGQLRVRASIH
jgi:hypothetical protein